MRKVLLFLLVFPVLLFAQEVQRNVLYFYGNHFSDIRAKHITNSAKKQNIGITFYSYAKYKKDKQQVALQTYDLVILDGGSSKRTKKMLDNDLETLKSKTQKMMAMYLTKDAKYTKGVATTQQKQINLYLTNNGMKNFIGFSQYLANDIFGISDIRASAPIIFPKNGIYHPDSQDKIFVSLDEYLKHFKIDLVNKPLVAITMNKNDFGSLNTKLIDATIRGLEKKGVVALAFYFSNNFRSTEKNTSYKKLLSLNNKFIPNAIINYKMIHQGQKRKKEFEDLGVPVISGLVFKNGNQQDYENDKQGITAQSLPFMLSIPESAGVINPMVVAAVDSKEKTTEVIPYQLESFLNRIENYLALQTMPNKEKKVAFFFWNFPSGQNGMMSSFLNVSESFANLFKALVKEGYSSTDVNASYFEDRTKDMMSLWYRDVDVQEVLKRDLCELYPLSRYEKWFSDLPKEVQKNLSDTWGKPSESNMLVKHDGEMHFVIPRMKIGNFIVLPQGSKVQDVADEKKAYHDMSIPANHGYLSVYLYVKEVFGADAIVHMGTHGSQEWLQGKEKGLSVYDSPNLAVGDVPVIYPYIVDDIGEAMQAKRRGSAVMLSHMTPPFSPAGLHGEIVELHDYIHRYEEMVEGAAKQNTIKKLIELAKKQNFTQELTSNLEKDIDAYILELHDYVHELANENQPLGLHTYGEVISDKYALLTVMQMLGDEYIKATDTIEEDSYQQTEEGHQFIQSYENIDKTKGYQYLYQALVEKKELKHEELKPFIKQASDYFEGLKNSLEIQNLIMALDAKYISTSTGGDPVRSPEVLPTGRNMHGFDPSKVPTKEAYETGKQLTEELIASYYTKHGKYPDKLAFSVWSMETMRQYGVIESQILYAMGIKPIWKEGGKVVGMEVIPYSELKRPRIDVVISATGLYRDAFSNVMEYLDEAVRTIVALKEKHNYVRTNSFALQKELIKEGMDKKKAEKLSTVRIFSASSGSYGTGLADRVDASGSWENDKGMADGYMSRMGFAFGSGMWGEKVADDLYKRVLKGTDAAILSRSSNVYGLLSSDDPFQYLGGLALAVRNIDGTTPDLYIANLRDKEKGKVESIEKFMSRELRTRVYHPQWIKAMQEEGKAGAAEISDMVFNTWGWEVMDPDSVRDDQWQELVEVYVNDKHELDMKEFFEKHNPESLAQITQRFLEAIRKGYFKTDEQTIKKLTETYMEIANKYDVYSDNEAFKEYVQDKAQGYGISPVLPAKAQVEFSAPKVAPGTQQVKGQQLQEQQENDKEIEDDIDYLTIFFLLLLMAIGAARARMKYAS